MNAGSWSTSAVEPLHAQPPLSGTGTMIKRVVIALVVVCAAGIARAQDCPTDVPADPGQRRHMAKKWFSKGASEAKAGNDIAAMKAYQCSLTFVPHAFTAYNVGQLAEKIGDLDAAITSYDQYLTLAPDAKDAKEIGDRVAVLKDRLAKVRMGDKSTEPPLDKLIEKTRDESFPEPPVTGKPTLTEVPGAELARSRQREAAYRTAAWITAGAGGFLLVGGVVSNVLARGQMDRCNSEYRDGHQSEAESACSNAKPLAYLSYGLLGVGAAAVATGAVLMFVHPGADNVALNVLPEGGLSLRWSGRY